MEVFCLKGRPPKQERGHRLVIPFLILPVISYGDFLHVDLVITYPLVASADRYLITPGGGFSKNLCLADYILFSLISNEDALAPY